MNLEIILVRTVLVLTAALSVGISLWGGYYLLTGLMSWRRPMDYGRHPAGTRFAVLIAARNEELVIGPLINSLLEQEYPAELYDIYVIPNNCTDNTALAARQFGAEVLECTVPVRSKGRCSALRRSSSPGGTMTPSASLTRTMWWTGAS